MYRLVYITKHKPVLAWPVTDEISSISITEVTVVQFMRYNSGYRLHYKPHSTTHNLGIRYKCSSYFPVLSSCVNFNAASCRVVQ